MVNSGELATIDSASVYGSLMVEVSRQRRAGHVVSANDAYDILRATIAVPVVSIYATDNLLEDMLDRSGVGAEFAFDVFGGSRSELVRLRDAVADLTDPGMT